MFNFQAYLFSFLAWSVLLVGAALSQSVNLGYVETHVSALPLYQLAEPYILSAFGAVFTVLLTWGLTQLQTRTNIRVSDQARATLQQAAINGAGRILAAQEGSIANMSIDVKSPLVAQEALKVAALVPDALSKIGVTPAAASEVLSNLIAGKLGILQATAAVPAPFNVSVVPPAGSTLATMTQSADGAVSRSVLTPAG